MHNLHQHSLAMIEPSKARKMKQFEKALSDGDLFMCASSLTSLACTLADAIVPLLEEHWDFKKKPIKSAAGRKEEVKTIGAEHKSILTRSYQLRNDHKAEEANKLRRTIVTQGKRSTVRYHHCPLLHGVTLG
jgi:hypothetical protein